jgi:hypothetical protein
MSDPTQPGPEPIRLALDHGEVVELDGGTLMVAGEPIPSIVLRLAPSRALSLSAVLGEWSAAGEIFRRSWERADDEMDLARVLELAAGVAGEEAGEEAGERDAHPLRAEPGPIPARARIAAFAILLEREPQMTDVQRLSLIDAACWWLGNHYRGPELAHALLEAACADGLTAQHAYLALIDRTPLPKPQDP